MGSYFFSESCNFGKNFEYCASISKSGSFLEEQKSKDERKNKK